MVFSRSSATERLLYTYELALDNLEIPSPVPKTKYGFYKFEAPDFPSTMEKYGITELPTIKIFRHGKAYDFSGPLLNHKGKHKTLLF